MSGNVYWSYCTTFITSLKSTQLNLTETFSSRGNLGLKRWDPKGGVLLTRGTTIHQFEGSVGLGVIGHGVDEGVGGCVVRRKN